MTVAEMRVGAVAGADGELISVGTHVRHGDGTRTGRVLAISGPPLGRVALVVTARGAAPVSVASLVAVST